MRSTSIQRRVRFGDTDPFGVLYFAALLEYFKEAVDEFLRESGEAPGDVYRNREERFGFPVVRIEADYMMPARYDEVITLVCAVESTGAKSVAFSVKAFKGGEEAARGTLTFAAISDEWKSIPLPERIAKIVRPWE